MDTINRTSDSRGFVNTIIGILVFGSLWGLSEIALGGALKAASFPYRSGLLTGIGMAIMAAALAVSKKPVIPIGVGAVAVLAGLLVVPVLHVSPMCKANSSLALVLESGSLTLAASLIASRTGKNVYGWMATGGSAALLASVAFYFAGTHFAPCAYLLSFSPGSFVVREGLVWAAFSAILVPLGYSAGERLAENRLTVVTKRSALYSGSSLVVAACWAMSALALALGL